MALFASSSLLKAQYCTPSYGNGCIYNDVISYFGLNTISNSSGCTPGSYANYDTIPATVLFIGQPYTASVSTIFGSAGVCIWIDFNDDFIYSSSERVGTTSSYIGANSTGNIALNIPLGSAIGTHHLRARLIYNDFATNADPCANYGYGEAEDYLVTLQNLPVCTGAPTPGYASSSVGSACANTSFNLNLANGSVASGLLFQWQSSLDGLTWVNLGSSQVTTSYTVTSISDTTYYRCITTCSLTAQTATSSSTFVNYTPLINCYCTPNVSWNCFDGDKIVDFSFANLTNQSNNCNTGGFSDWTNVAGAEINLNAGTTYTFNTNTSTSGFYGDATVGFYIDYNQNALFESSEFTYLGHGSGLTYSNTTTVPINAASNSVRMRLILDVTGNVALDPCNNVNFSSYGQVLDYKVNLIAAPICSGTLNIPTTVSSNTSVCQNVPFTLDLNGNSISSGIEYQWQYSLNGTLWSNLGTAQSTIPYSVSTQSTTTYYRCISTCINSASSSTSTPVIVNQNLPTACYCEPQSIYCNSSSITNVLFETLNDTPVCNSINGYTNSSTLTPVPLNANQNYTISIDLNVQSGNGYVGLWIDFNQDGFFDNNNEYTYVGSNTIGNLTTTVNVPFTAIGGNTRMRIKMESTWGSAPTLSACINSNPDGQVIDYSILITPVAGCSGTPNAGSAISTSTLVCNNTPFTLDLTGNSIASNIVYQWQSSLNNSSWTNLTSSQTNVPYTVNSQSVATYYRCVTSCTTGTLSTSSVIFVNQNAITNCYCIPPPSDCSNSTQITNVLINTLNNASLCSPNGYIDYSGSVPTVSLNIAQTYSIAIKVGDDFNNFASVWIDFNQNGSFDTTEYCNIGSVSGLGDSTISGPIVIPSNALLGNTRMRVRNNINYSFYNDEPCAAGANAGRALMPMPSEGETEDYMVTILQQNCSTFNVPPSVSAIGTSTVCYAQSDTLDLGFNFQVVSGITYQWKTSTGGTYTNEGSASNSPQLVITPTISASYFCEIMCNGSVILNSDTIFITVKPSTNISGTVTVFPNTATPVAGRVILYKYEPYFTQFDSVAGQNIGAAGDYNFASFKSGIYIVKALPNLLSLQIAYGDTAINWKTAKQIVHGCSVNDIQNIQVKALPSATATTGPGRLSGIITEALGYEPKFFGGPANESEFKPTIPGNPIGGIVVKGGRNPGGQMFTQTITESTGPVPAKGTYTLSNLPVGDYFILVDITGLDTNKTYHVKITADNNSFQNLDFTVDSIQINPVYETNVGVNEIKFDEHKIKVYPNPATNYLTVQYNLQNTSTVKIELFDILGKEVKVLLPETKQPSDKYKNTWPLDELKSGLYFLKMNIDGTESTIKISVSN